MKLRRKYLRGKQYKGVRRTVSGGSGAQPKRFAALVQAALAKPRARTRGA